MGDKTETPRPTRWEYFKANVVLWVGVGAGLVAIVSAIVAWWPDPPEKTYRQALYKEVCLGDLAAAGRMADPTAYAGGGGRIDRAAWLNAMDGVRSHLVAGRAGLLDPVSPKSLRDEWQATVDALDVFIRYWGEYRAYTATLSPAALTVFDYPNGEWKAKNSSASTALSVPLVRLMGEKCETTPSSSGP